MKIKIFLEEKFVKNESKFENLFSDKKFFMLQIFIASILFLFSYFFIEENQKYIATNLTLILAVYIFSFFIIFELIAVRDISYTTLPFLLMTAMFTKAKLESYNISILILASLPALILVIFAMILKLYLYKVKEFNPGSLMTAFLILSLVFIFAGFAHVSIKQFFNPNHLFILILVSLAPTITYLYAKHYISRKNNRKSNNIFFYSLISVGIFLVFALILLAANEQIENLQKIAREKNISFNSLGTKVNIFKTIIEADYKIPNREYISIFMMIVGVVPFYFAFKCNGKKGILSFLLGVILIIGAIFTRYKQSLFLAIVLLFVMIVLSLIFTINQNRYLYLGFFLGIIFISILLILSLNAETAKQINRINFSPDGYDIKLYEIGYANLINYPLLGSGIQNFYTLIDSNRTLFDLYSSSYHTSKIIQLFGSIGFLGILALLYLLSKKFIIFIRMKNKFNLINAVMYSTYIISVMFTSAYFYVIPFSILMTLVSTYSEQINQEEYNSDESEKLKIYKEIGNAQS